MYWPKRQIIDTDFDLRLLKNTPMQFLIGAALLAIGMAAEIPWLQKYSAAILIVRISLIFGMLACALISARFPTRLVNEMLIFGGMIINIIGMAILGNLKNTYLETSTPVIYQALAFIAIFMSIRLPVFAILVSCVGLLWFWLMPSLLSPKLDEAMLTSNFFGFISYAVMVLIGKHLMQRLLCVENRNSKKLVQMEELHELAMRDITSGAYNLQYFNKLLPEYISHARNCKQTFSLCLFSLPDENINHDNGKENAIRLQRFVLITQEMMRGGDAVFKIGKVLFAILLPETKAKSAANIAERIRDQWQRGDNINKSLQNNEDSRPCCAISVAEFCCDTLTTNNILQAAEKALSKANNQGNNNIIIYHEGMEGD